MNNEHRPRIKDMNAPQRKAWYSLKAVPTITELSLVARALNGHFLVTGKRNGEPFEYVLTIHGYINATR